MSSTSPRIIQCTNCDALKEAYDRVECTILDLMRNKWSNTVFNTSMYYSQSLMNRLMRYRRVIGNRLYNHRYPCGGIDTQDLVKLAVTHAYKKGDCSECPECFPTIAPTTTTSTTTLSPGCCALTGVFAEVEVINLYYWGWKDTQDQLTDAEIIASPFFDTFTTGQDLTAFYLGGSGSPFFLWMAEPIGEPLKTKWQDLNQPLNNGSIGTDQDLFDAPLTSPLFRFYITEYVTQQPNPIQFKVV